MWVYSVCVLLGCGCWLLKRKRERRIVKKNKKSYLNKVAKQIEFEMLDIYVVK